MQRVILRLKLSRTSEGRRNMHPSRNLTRGAALVEMAIVAPLILIFVSGIYVIQTSAYDRALLRGAVYRAGRVAAGAALAGSPSCSTQFQTVLQQEVTRLNIGRAVTIDIREGGGGNLPGSSGAPPVAGESDDIRVVTFVASVPLCAVCIWQSAATVSVPLIIENYQTGNNAPYCGGTWPRPL